MSRIPTQKESDLAALVSAIRLVSHIATPDNCRKHEGLYRDLVSAAAYLRAAHDKLNAPENEEGAHGDAPAKLRCRPSKPSTADHQTEAIP